MANCEFCVSNISLAPLKQKMLGPDGVYELVYTPVEDRDGKVEVEISGVSMTWWVEIIEIDNGLTSLSGMTSGSKVIWQEQYWFQFWPSLQRPKIDYWGAGVIWRSDLAVLER